jgi:hypothetical protein
LSGVPRRTGEAVRRGKREGARDDFYERA